jgi:hypothetical protein
MHNYQVDPDSPSAVVLTSYAANPTFRGAAFTPASYGTSSQFYNIDGAGTPDFLQTSSNINLGTPSLSAVGSGLTGSDVGQPVGLNIPSAGLGMTTIAGSLYSVNLSTGAATLVAALTGAPNIRGLAVVPTSFPPVITSPLTTPPTVTIKGPKKVTTTNASIVIKGTASSATGITKLQYKIGKGKFKAIKGSKTKWKFTAMLIKPGANVITVQVTAGNRLTATAKVKVIKK